MKTHSFKLIPVSAIIFCLLAFNTGFTQTFKIFQEKTDTGYDLFASNPELYPVSATIELTLDNLTFSESDKSFFVIPAKNEKYKIGSLKIKKTTSKYGFSFKYRTTMGDISVTDIDKSIVYDLPFQKGKSFKIYQGYNGSFSHKNENSLDFSMPEGTELVAARDGIVVQVVQNNTIGCAEEECKKYNNYITILHSDGSFASYLHIKFNGAKVKIGDAVKHGDVIALSGNVGWTNGPHLHFVCFTAGFEKRNTLETKFRINNGTETTLLTEGTTYMKNY